MRLRLIAPAAARVARRNRWSSNRIPDQADSERLASGVEKSKRGGAAVAEGGAERLASGFWLLASGFWLLASGFWLLASGFRLLASGFWLLASGFWLLRGMLGRLGRGEFVKICTLTPFPRCSIIQSGVARSLPPALQRAAHAWTAVAQRSGDTALDSSQSPRNRCCSIIQSGVARSLPIALQALRLFRIGIGWPTGGEREENLLTGAHGGGRFVPPRLAFGGERVAVHVPP